MSPATDALAVAESPLEVESLEQPARNAPLKARVAVRMSAPNRPVDFMRVPLSTDRVGDAIAQLHSRSVDLPSCVKPAPTLNLTSAKGNIDSTVGVGMLPTRCQTERVNSPSSSPRVVGAIESSTDVVGSLERVWDCIVNVDIHAASHPLVFRIAGIPDPVRAEVVSTGVGGERIAYFATGKRFLQRITKWVPPREYAFTFNPEKGFKVLYFFDLSDGLVQIPAGSYLLSDRSSAAISTTRIRLGTEYSIDHRVAFLFELPVRVFLRGFQRYLLTAITRNVAAIHSGTKDQ